MPRAARLVMRQGHQRMRAAPRGQRASHLREVADVDAKGTTGERGARGRAGFRRGVPGGGAAVGVPKIQRRGKDSSRNAEFDSDLHAGPDAPGKTRA
jgi:hypothetical protein